MGFFLCYIQAFPLPCVCQTSVYEIPNIRSHPEVETIRMGVPLKVYFATSSSEAQSTSGINLQNNILHVQCILL